MIDDDHKPACGLCGNSGIARDPHCCEPEYCGCVYGATAREQKTLESAPTGLTRFTARYGTVYGAKTQTVTAANPKVIK